MVEIHFLVKVAYFISLIWQYSYYYQSFMGT